MTDETNIETPPVVEDTPPIVTAEDPVFIMSSHFSVHPENQVADVRGIVDVLIPAITTSKERRKIVSTALNSTKHPLLEQLQEVLDTL